MTFACNAPSGASSVATAAIAVAMLALASVRAAF